MRAVEKSSPQQITFTQSLSEVRFFDSPRYYSTPRMNPQLPSVTRRHFLQASAAISAGAILGLRSRAAAAPEAKILETKIISQQPEFYHGWSTVARRKNGERVVHRRAAQEWRAVGHVVWRTRGACLPVWTSLLDDLEGRRRDVGAIPRAV
jgi:hypothetical protein